MPGARIDVRQLETGKPVGIPVAIRISGEDIADAAPLRAQPKAIFARGPDAERVRDDWGDRRASPCGSTIDPDRANLAGVTNLDVALLLGAAINGCQVDDAPGGDKQIPIVARLRMDERAQLVRRAEPVRLRDRRRRSGCRSRQVSHIDYELATEKIAPQPVPHHHGVGVPDPGCCRPRS